MQSCESVESKELLQKFAINTVFYTFLSGTSSLENESKSFWLVKTPELVKTITGPHKHRFVTHFRFQIKNANSGIRNVLQKKMISVWECLALYLNLQSRCHPLNILLTQISSSFSAMQIPSFLLTDTLVSSLTHTHIHFTLTCWYPSALSCVPSCATASCRHTETPSLYFCKHTQSLLCVWNWHMLWKWLSPSADLSGSIAQRAGLSAQQGQDLWGITYTDRCGGVSLWPVTSFKLSRIKTYWPFSARFWLWGFWTLKN